MSLPQAVQTTRPEFRSSLKKVRPLERPIDIPKLGRSNHLTNAAVATPQDRIDYIVCAHESRNHTRDQQQTRRSVLEDKAEASLGNVVGLKGMSMWKWEERRIGVHSRIGELDCSPISDLGA